MESLAVEKAGLSRELLPSSSMESALETESAKAIESLAAIAESESWTVSFTASSVLALSLSLLRLERLSSWEDTLNELIIRKKMNPNISFSTVIYLFRKFFIFLQDAKVTLISKIAKRRLPIMYLKYIPALVCTFLLPVLSCHSASAAQETVRPKLGTVVIDAGHGGKDAGCVSRDGRTYEKNLTLAIAKQLGQKIKAEYPDVKVYYTRLTDRYLTLNERADIANRNHADLFISIHINANNSVSPSGFSAHIFGRSSGKDSDLFKGNMELCRRENSVILLEDDYSTNYQGFDPNDPESFIFFNLMQNAFYEQSLLFAGEVIQSLEGGPITKNRGISQDPFFVLWKTSMPSVLLELGFISNSADLKVLKSEKGRDQIAGRLFNAFRKFKTKYDSSLDLSAQSLTKVEASPQASSTIAGMSSYGIQIMAIGREVPLTDKSFNGYTPVVIKEGDIYKYIVCVSSSEKEVRSNLKSVSRKFPGAFVVKVENGKVSRR